MISGRPSTSKLTLENILALVSDYDIFLRFCTNFEKPYKIFCSDLREDDNPSCCIQEYQDKLLYKDFTTGEAYNWVQYIQKKYEHMNLSFIDTLTLVDQEFNLGLSSQKDFKYKELLPNSSKLYEGKKIKVKERDRFQFKVTDFDFSYLFYWEKYGISRTTLHHFNVAPLLSYIKNDEEERFMPDTAFVYKAGTGFRIYRPFADRQYKFRGNLVKSDVHGLDQLPEVIHNAAPIVITSSLKDVMVLYEMGLFAIAMTGEAMIPPDSLVNELQLRGPKSNIYVLLDNDYAGTKNWGQIAAEKILKQYPDFINLCIPDKYQSKDPSDLAATVGFHNARDIILKLLVNATAQKLQK